MRRILPLSALVLLLTGCGLIPDRTLVYQEAEPAEPMKIPEDMTFFGHDELYPVPDADRRVERTGESFEPPKPPKLEVARRDDSPADSIRPIRRDAGRAVLTRDGNDYPVIMLPTDFAWAWEHTAAALEASELRINDRNREAGIFRVRVPREHNLPGNEVQLRLSHTVNGIQLAVLSRDGRSLVDRDISAELLETLHGAF